MISNRPFSRSCIKIAVRLLLGRSRAHVQDWFPGLNLELATADRDGTIQYRGELVGRLTSPLRALEEKPANVLIVGSGPSVARCDLTRAAGSSCLLLNGALHLFPSVIAKPLAIAIEDERFVWRHFDLVKRIPAGCICLLSVSVIRAICELDRTWLRNRQIVLIDNVRKPYGVARRDTAELRKLPYVRLSEDGDVGFSEDPFAGIFQAGSVAVSAAQFAVAWRPRSIGFVGIDLSNADEPRYYETTDKAYSGIVAAQKRIVDHLVMTRSIAAESGIEVVNHSPISALVGMGFGYDATFAKAE
ncbi:glycosyl transferase [Sinorhizobium meliloti]|uniref:glycosyl transferase n=1 Tax=Rhizobium meliloti TaxID=382 RepID=UPI000FD78C14|nr:glycosyl transferase [Sinorhizobium meliloti]MQX65605.1 glycosyl transferase [Sinorhizobium meliloti]RVI54550.1 glycosyl transferase [Sinorhizobium meliloti]RVP58877.1 glycosyl transferase [Sinorhizobium meliloti]